MFDRVTIRASDVGASQRFYETVLGEIGGAQADFSVVAASAEVPATRGLHIGFGAPSREAVDAFWRAGVEAGFENDGEPGPRPVYGDDYYGGFLLDPDGNSAEAVHFDHVRRGVDHLWIRVADVAAAKRFYETIAPRAGIALATDRPERAQFVGEPGSFSVLSGAHVTESLQMAFPVSAAETAGEFRDPDGNTVELVLRTC
jgi:catechol 2,3-dioxygenase-like lactoylglutathione lyase family enzyme